jgi:ribonuclease P protein component
MTAHRFPRELRIRTSPEYERIYSARQRFSDPRMLIYATANGQSTTRLGLSVSKKHGNSVVRHLIKRRLREAFRLSQHELPAGLDLVVIPQAGLLSASLEELRWSLERLCRKAGQKLLPVSQNQPQW